jgi:dTDP-4-dehydrorhamnose 3,5-epimerase
MKFEEQKIPGTFLISPTPYRDDRGVFRRHFCAEEFSKRNIVFRINQANLSENPFRGTLRGFHMQKPPFSEGKTLSCLVGEIYDIIVDLRPDSPTFMQWVSFYLSAEKRQSIHIPPGCANAFLTLDDNVTVHYYCSESYNPSAEIGVRWDDPQFRFEWPIKPTLISIKDSSIPDFTGL